MADQNPEKRPPDSKPIEHPKVDVLAVPKSDPKIDNREYSKKVRDSLKKDVEKALEDNKSGGHQRQLESAREAVRKAGTQIDPNKIEKVVVRVGGKVDKTKVVQTHEMKPGEQPVRKQ